MPPSPLTTEERNKAVVARYFSEVLDRRRYELMAELIAPDCVLHRPGFDVVGIQAAESRLRATFAAFVSFRSELTGLIAEGDMVAVRIAHFTRVRPHTLRGRAGDIEVKREQDLDWTAIVQFRLHDGKIAEEWVMRDELGMLGQLGRITVDSSPRAG